MQMCADVTCQRPFTFPQSPKPSPPPPQLLERDISPILKDELSSINRQLDQLLQSQAAWQPVLMQIGQRQETMQTSLTFVEKAVGLLQSGVNGDRLIPDSNQAVAVTTAQFPQVVLETNQRTDPSSLPQRHPSVKSELATKVLQRREQRLKKIFSVTEEERRREEKRRQLPFYRRIMNDRLLDLEILDTIAVIVVIANTIFMGVRLDMDDEKNDDVDVWVIFDITFAAVFALELLVRVFLKGFRTQFCTDEVGPRTFDACLILMDVAQVILDLAKVSQAGGAVSVSLFRIIRFGRMVRILRLLNTNVFADLLAMMQGIGGGLTTLIWAALLFTLLVYIAALLCREAFGRKSAENVQVYFNSVPRSMFTVFRCSFGDCSSQGGMPIFEHVNNHYGGMYSLLYCFFIFVVTIGLFNVISAIFVDGAMSVAAAANARRAQERLDNEVLMSVNVSALVKCLLESAGHSVDGVRSDKIKTLAYTEIDRSCLDHAIQDPVVIEALNNLDIDPHDHSHLSDILDPDHGGTVTVLDLMNGLQRLRGQPRRSDIISIGLMVRSIQDSIEDLHVQVASISRP